ncbi:MAG: polyprenyl synthetase family protein [Treponema sp.]|jgi:octaprenyl-diphosphate synthase|nr:polyprenyl synthetase family protein [Treponema sp.]
MDQQYTRRLEKIEAALEHWLPETPDTNWAAEVFPGLADKVNPALLRALTAPGKDLLSRGGKRWRPLLMTLVCEALGGGDAALPLVPLVEFCHNASLIHDDIEDNSDERRGKPAVHIIHGVDTAINSGCFLYFLPLACIDSWAANLSKQMAHDCRATVYTLWSHSLRKLHLGQAIDIHWHRNFNLIPSVDEYFTMCKLKTGCLARFAAELGAAVAAMNSANPVSAPTEYLGTAAEKLGVGFQILDDVKNVTSGIPGKKRGDDVVEGKKSLPVLLFLHRWPEKKEMVFRCFNAARSGGVCAPEVEELIQALMAAGVIAEAEAQGKALIAEARENFTAPPPGFPMTAEGRALLGGLVDNI